MTRRTTKTAAPKTRRTWADNALAADEPERPAEAVHEPPLVEDLDADDDVDADDEPVEAPAEVEPPGLALLPLHPVSPMLNTATAARAALPVARICFLSGRRR